MSEFEKLQKQVKLLNSECSKLFKVSERTITRWRSDEIEAPESVLLVLRSRVTHAKK